MIQRIQSFYLVLAFVGVVLMFLFPTATFELSQGGFKTTSELGLLPGGENVIDEANSTAFIPQYSVLLMVMAIVLGAGILASIFMYKNRVRQMRFVSMLALLNIVYVGIMFLASIPDSESVIANSEVHTTYSVGTFVPLVTLILTVLAQRAIRRDEMKVRAADRLR